MTGSNGRGRGTGDLSRGFGDCGFDEWLGGGPNEHMFDGSDGVGKCGSEEREMGGGEA